MRWKIGSSVANSYVSYILLTIAVPHFVRHFHKRKYYRIERHW